jgi:hypothetical protein
VKLIDDWKRVIVHSWSSRLAIGSAVLVGAEQLLPLVQDLVPRGVFGVASFLLMLVVPVARIVHQSNLATPDQDCDGSKQ